MSSQFPVTDYRSPVAVLLTQSKDNGPLTNLLACQSVTTDNGCWMNLLFHQFISVFQQLSCNNHLQQKTTQYNHLAMAVHFTLNSIYFNFKLTKLSQPNVQYCYIQSCHNQTCSTATYKAVTTKRAVLLHTKLS